MATQPTPPSPASRSRHVILPPLPLAFNCVYKSTPHTLRHTFATRMLRAGASLEHVRDAMRHSDILTTARIYSHLGDPDRKATFDLLN